MRILPRVHQSAESVLGRTERGNRVRGRIQVLPPGSATRASPSANSVGETRHQRGPVPHLVVVGGRGRRSRLTSAYLLGSVVVALAAAPASAVTPPTGGAVGGPAPQVHALQCRTGCMGAMAG